MEREHDGGNVGTHVYHTCKLKLEWEPGIDYNMESEWDQPCHRGHLYEYKTSPAHSLLDERSEQTRPVVQYIILHLLYTYM